MENNKKKFIEDLFNNGGGGGGKVKLDTSGNLVVQKRVQCENCGIYVLPQSMSSHKKTQTCKLNPIAGNRMSYHEMKRAETTRY